MRLIDADKAVEQINEWLHQTRAIPLNTSYHFELLGCVKDCPTIDAVPVVRCGECLSAKWYENGDFYCQKWGERCDSPYTLTGQSKTDFCSHGSKKECKEG